MIHQELVKDASANIKEELMMVPNFSPIPMYYKEDKKSLEGCSTNGESGPSASTSAF